MRSSRAYLDETRRLTTLRQYVFALILCAAGSDPLAADLRLERQHIQKRFAENGAATYAKETTEVVTIGESAARLDTGSQTFIVRERDGRFLWVNHDAKAFAEIRLPVKLEELLTDAEKECLRTFPMALANLEATVRATGETGIVQGLAAERLWVEGQSPGPDLEFKAESWNTHDLPADLGPYYLLIESRAALSPATRGWIGKVLAKGGYPVESSLTIRFGDRRRVDEHRLVGVEEVKAEEGRYHPPEDYSGTLTRPPLDLQCVGPEPPP